jgi:Na+/proline symporter
VAPAFAVLGIAMLIAYALSSATLALAIAGFCGTVVAVIGGLFLLTRRDDGREREVLSRWLATVAAEVEAPAR